MRKLSFLVALAAIASVVVPPAAQAQVEPFDASFKGKQTRNAPPCAVGLVCGTGTIDGYGAASFSLTPTSLGPAGGACRAVTAVTLLTLSDGSGSLTLSAAGELCTPGRSASAPGMVGAFGNPLAVSATYEVIGGTGVFAGASGDGAATLTSAGARQHLSASGTLDL